VGYSNEKGVYARSQEYLQVKFTKARIDKLKSSLPKCKIEWDSGVIEPKK